MRKLTCLLSVILLIVSCKKEEEPTKNNCPGNVYITSADLLNCQYRTGSYWVSIDSVSMQTDSTYIHNFGYGFKGDFCTTYENHEFLTISNPWEVRSYIVLPDGLFRGFEGTVNSAVPIYDGYNGSLAQNEIRYDSLFVYDQFYSQVLRTEITNDATAGGKHSFYYVNSDYGFLKHEVYDGSTLISNKLLMRKNIVR